MVVKYYYNGHLLPQISQDESLPFVYVIMYVENGESLYQVFKTDCCFFIGESYGMPAFLSGNSGNASIYQYTPETDEDWQFLDDGETKTNAFVCVFGEIDETAYSELVYANVDVHNGALMSGDIYLEASSPILYEEKKYIINKSTLTNIANSIRSKTGTTDLVEPENMPSAIDGISSGGGGSETFVYGFKSIADDISNLGILTIQ